MNKRIEKITANYFDDQITDDETKELITWIKKGNENTFNQYVTFNFSVEQLKIAKENNQVSSWESIVSKINDHDSKKVIPLVKRSFFKYEFAQHDSGRMECILRDLSVFLRIVATASRYVQQERDHGQEIKEPLTHEKTLHSVLMK